jgi:hypothetical protein
MKPITAVLTIAGATLVLTGCDSPQEKQSAKSIFQAFGVTDLVSESASPAPAVVAYVEPEAVKQPEPPPPCENYQWRWNWYSCEGVLLGPVE